MFCACTIMITCMMAVLLKWVRVALGPDKSLMMPLLTKYDRTEDEDLNLKELPNYFCHDEGDDDKECSPVKSNTKPVIYK